MWYQVSIAITTLKRLKVIDIWTVVEIDASKLRSHIDAWIPKATALVGALPVLKTIFWCISRCKDETHRGDSRPDFIIKFDFTRGSAGDVSYETAQDFDIIENDSKMWRRNGGDMWEALLVSRDLTACRDWKLVLPCMLRLFLKGSSTLNLGLSSRMYAIDRAKWYIGGVRFPGSDNRPCSSAMIAFTGSDSE